MKEERKGLDELDTAFGKTPDMFHRRVEQTLRILQTERTEECKMKRKANGAIVLLVALLLISAVGAAAKFSGVLDFITNTAASNWVLDDAEAMVHTDGDSVSIGACTASIKEWVCDGRRLFVTISVIDPALATEGYYVPKDEDEDYLAGLEHYGLTHGLMEASSADGCVQVRSADFGWGDEARFEILYTYEIELENMLNTFTVTIPVSCSSGKSTLSISVTSADCGAIRSFGPSEIQSFDDYTAQITRLEASSLRTYGELKLVFDASADAQTREKIAGDYMEGLLTPNDGLNIHAGEGEEIAYPTGAVWQNDELIYVISLEGNPRENYPDVMTFYPRKGASTFDGEGEWPPLSKEGSVNIK